MSFACSSPVGGMLLGVSGLLLLSLLSLIVIIIIIRPDDSISTKDLMEKSHQLPISVMIKERSFRWLGHAARRLDNNMVKQLFFATRIPGHVQPVGRPCGTWMHYARRDVKDMGQQRVTAA